MKHIIIMLAICAMASCTGGTKKTATVVSASKTILITDSIFTAPVTDTIDMGRLREGETVSQTVVLRNETSGPMIILSIKSSCGCTTVQYGNKPVEAGGSTSLTFEYDSKGFSGFQMKTVTVTTSLSQNPCSLILLADVAK